MKKKNKIIITILAIFAVVAVMIGCYAAFGPKTSEGSKTVKIQITDDQNKVVDYTVKTDAEFLRGAMEDAQKEGLTFSGTESKEYGLSVETINGVTADYNKDSAYWAFYVNDEYCNYGVDSQPVNDGDEFKIEYTVWKEE